LVLIMHSNLVIGLYVKLQHCAFRPCFQCETHAVIRRDFPTSEPDVLKRFTEQFSMTYWFYALLFRRLLYKSPEKTQHMFAVITTGCADLTENNHSSTSKRQNAIFGGFCNSLSALFHTCLNSTEVSNFILKNSANLPINSYMDGLSR